MLQVSMAVAPPIEWQTFAWACFVASLFILASMRTKGSFSRLLTGFGCASTLAAMLTLSAYLFVWVPDCSEVPWYIMWCV